MLPEKLSTDLTSLNPNQDRLAAVVEITLNDDNSFGDYSIYLAWVHNYAKLNYNTIGEWLDNPSKIVPTIAATPELAEQLRLQDSIAQKIKRFRISQGMLTFGKIEAKAVVKKNAVVEVLEVKPNRARELIEFFMIAANNATTKLLKDKNFPIFRRIVRTPKRWDRIVELAKTHGETLPSTPNAIALEKFLQAQRAANPKTFPDLSLAFIKLIGKGEYVIQLPGQNPIIHFGLSLREYSHSTAPNRRYPDLIAQRLIKAAISNEENPYSISELEALAQHCTEKEDDAEKVQRQMVKSAAAMFLSSQIGKEFDCIVTGASNKGTYVRLFHPPIEGKLVKGFQGVDVGCLFKVKLLGVNIPNGYIDFERISPPICA